MMIEFTFLGKQIPLMHYIKPYAVQQHGHFVVLHKQCYIKRSIKKNEKDKEKIIMEICS